MEGYDLQFVSRKTGLSYAKLRQIVSRNQELQSLPYSVKAGKNRVFFDPFVEWLKKYEGIASVTSVTEPVTNVTKLPNGKQLEAFLSIYGRQEAAKRLDHLIGYVPPAVAPESKPAPMLALPAEIRRPPVPKYATSDEIEQVLRSLIPGEIAPKTINVAKAIENRERENALDEAYVNSIQPQLGLQ